METRDQVMAPRVKPFELIELIELIAAQGLQFLPLASDPT